MVISHHDLLLVVAIIVGLVVVSNYFPQTSGRIPANILSVLWLVLWMVIVLWLISFFIHAL